MRKKPVARVVAENVDRLMAAAGYSNASLATKLGGQVTQSTIGRIRNAESTARVSSVESIAAAFGLQAWQLLVADISEANPPMLAAQALSGHTQLDGAAAELVQVFQRLSDRDRALLIADAKKYLGTPAA